jgi:hypothetical protein
VVDVRHDGDVAEIVSKCDGLSAGGQDRPA